MAELNSRFAMVTEKEILHLFQYFSPMCCVVTEFVYANTIILFNLGE